MAELSQGILILLSIGSLIILLAIFVAITVFIPRRKTKGIISAIEERARLEGKTLITNEESMSDVVSMATALASSVDALADERAKLNGTDVSSPNYRHIHDNITHLEDSIERGTELLNKTIRDSKEISPAQLAQVRSIIASIAPDIKAENYSELKKLVMH